ncbi:hypothetical protein H8E77_01265 [bacterium]|nr:hypothetical protein [bacterium]
MDATFHCQHCHLSGKGLNGPRGLKARLESDDSFLPLNLLRSIPNPTQNVKPNDKLKEEKQPITSKDKLPPIANALPKNAKEYLQKQRGTQADRVITFGRELDARLSSGGDGNECD